MAKQIFKVEEARELTANSEQRKDTIREQMNEEIRKQSTNGLKWAAYPSGLSQHEILWLNDELILLGYTSSWSEKRCSW